MVSVIIPTYNEKEILPDIINLIYKEVPDLKEIIVVDDDSPDWTWQKALELAQNQDKIRVIRRLKNNGLPQSLAEGISSSSGGIILWMDADFSSLPLTLTKLLKYTADYDIVVASRYVSGGADIGRGKIRFLASWLFNHWAKIILGTRIIDLTSGCIAARRNVFDKITIEGVYGEYCVRFLYLAEKMGFKIKEAPYISLPRIKGITKTSQSFFVFIKFGFIYLFMILKLLFTRKSHGS